MGFGSSRRQVPVDRRQMMIDQTSAFLTWALEHDVQLPRIPRLPVEQGGYDRVLARPGARAAAHFWWLRAIQTMDKIADHLS
jgi:hypothetical protein